MRRLHLWGTMALCATAMTLFSGKAVQAQTDPGAGPLRLKVGGYLPTEGGAREVIGTNFLSLGLGWDIGTVDGRRPARLEVYADYFDRIKHHQAADIGRFQVSAYGLGVAVRFDADPNGTLKTWRPYYGIGTGVYRMYARQTAVISVLDPRPVTERDEQFGVGVKFLIGAQLTGGVFGELEYNILPRPEIFNDDINVDGIQLRIGYRFGGRR
ncbi:MAG: hypothetical protein SFU56_21215 [Capsulimonadales bacterium]|nr:hypothetical protein [Capsulimonadales bacterium]